MDGLGVAFGSLGNASTVGGREARAIINPAFSHLLTASFYIHSSLFTFLFSLS